MKTIETAAGSVSISDIVSVTIFDNGIGCEARLALPPGEPAARGCTTSREAHGLPSSEVRT